MGFISSNFFIENSGDGSLVLPYSGGVVAALSYNGNSLEIIRSSISELLETNSFCIHRALAVIGSKKSDWQNEQMFILHINMLNGDLDLFILRSPSALYKTRTGQAELFGNVQSDLNASSTVVDSISLGSFSSMFITLDQRLLTVLQNHIPFLFSKKEILKTISEFIDETEAAQSNFIFINNDISRNKSISKRDTIKAALSEIITYEESLDQFISEHFPQDVMASTNSMLIFNELVINALEHGALGISRDEKQKAMHSGSYDEFISQKEQERNGTIQIEVDLYKNSVARFTIRDSGKGFDYSKYTNSLPSADKFHGRGVMMSRQGSLAMFYSEQGRAVTFFMRFSQNSEAVEDLLDSEALLKEFTILYAEDDNFVRTHVALVLKRLAKNVLLAQDGKEALDLYTKYQPQIVISDVEMPHLNGLALAREIRKHSKDTPILITTAYNTDEFFNEAYSVGVDKFLSKPISISTLREVLYGFARAVYAREFMLKELQKNIAK